MKSHGRKMIAPVVIAVVLALYYAVFAVVCLLVPFPWWGRLLLGIVPAAVIGLCIYVTVQRINEIRSGEEDDLGNY